VEDLNEIFGDGTFSDFFRSIFGGAAGASSRTAGRARPSAGYQQPVTISLEEAHNGARRQLTTDSRRMEVKIPPGVKTGSKVRVAGAGPEGTDLYLIVDVTEDARFERDGYDLRTTANVNVFTATLGGEADVETLDGKIKLNIPAGTQPEQVFRLAGRGMPHLNKKDMKGDLYVKLKVQIPKYLSSKQRELLEDASKIKY
jgi:curved DNA-binding protein